MIYRRSDGEAAFTLIELLVVIGIIAILMAIVLVAVNPGRQFASARNTEREAHLYAVTNAVYQFAAEHDGNLPDPDDVVATNNFPECSVGARDIGTADLNLGAAGFSDDGADGVDDPIVPTYIAEVPVDPSDGTAAVAGYTICVDANGRLLAAATNPELGATIQVTR